MDQKNIEDEGFRDITAADALEEVQEEMDEGTRSITAAQALEEVQEEMDDTLQKHINKLSLDELLQLQRISRGVHIYGPTEQATYDTAMAMTSSGRLRLMIGKALQGKRPPNRTERRIIIANSRRMERRDARQSRRAVA